MGSSEFKSSTCSELSRVLIVSVLFVVSSVNCDLFYEPNDIGLDNKIAHRQFPLTDILKNHQNWLGLRNASNGQCETEVKIVNEGLESHQMWALRIADSSGQVGPNFVWGSNYFLGSEVACRSVNEENTLGLSSDAESVHKILSSESPVQVDYRVFIANFSSNSQIDVKFNVRALIHFGLCLPKSCDPKDFYKPIEEYLINLEEFSIDAVEILYHKDKLNKDWILLGIPEFYVLIGIFAIVFAVSIVYRILRNRLTERENQDGNRFETANSENIKVSKCRQILSCFSIGENAKKLFSTEASKKDVKSINGIRVFASVWIITLHTNVYSRFAVASLPELQYLMSSPSVLLRTLMYGFVSVDSFFVVSGFLLVYNFLNNDKLRTEIEKEPLWELVKRFFRNFLSRYLRLIPSVIVIMIAIMVTGKYLDQGSVFDTRNNVPDLQCSTETVIKNLLFMQDFGNSLLNCGSWLWYLANDMQYYLIFLALLFVHQRHPMAAKTIFAIVTMSTLGATFCICYLNGFTIQADVIYRLFQPLYTAPHVRVIPYLGGMITGYAGHWIRKHPIKIGQIQARVLTGGLILYLLGPILFGSDVEQISSFVCSLGYSLGKLIYGLCIGSLVLVNIFSPVAIVQRVLECRAFHHLNKVCYGVYLVHPLVIMILFGLRSQATYLSGTLLLTYSLAVAFISYVLAVTLVIFVEVPFVRLSHVILKK